MNVLEPIHWAILLMVVGCLLVVLEFFIPSGGVLGFLSLASIVFSIVLAFMHEGSTTGLIFIVTAMVVVPSLLGVTIKYWPKTPMGKAFLGELPKEGDLMPEDVRKSLVGQFGIAKSKMLPSGSVEIDRQQYDAVTQGSAIEQGDRVVVQEVRGNRVVVRQAADDERPEHERPEDLLSRPIEELGIESIDENPLA